MGSEGHKIQRKSLFSSLGNVKWGKWPKAIDKLNGVYCTQRTTGTSHIYAVRREGYEPSDTKGYLFNIYPKMSKQINQEHFKYLLDEGI